MSMKKNFMIFGIISTYKKDSTLINVSVKDIPIKKQRIKMVY